MVVDKTDLCSGDAMIGKQCTCQAIWRNQNSVEVCEHHKLLLDAFTWEGRNERRWELISNTSISTQKEAFNETISNKMYQ